MAKRVEAALATLIWLPSICRSGNTFITCPRQPAQPTHTEDMRCFGRQTRRWIGPGKTKRQNGAPATVEVVAPPCSSIAAWPRGPCSHTAVRASHPLPSPLSTHKPAPRWRLRPSCPPPHLLGQVGGVDALERLDGGLAPAGPWVLAPPHVGLDHLQPTQGPAGQPIAAAMCSYSRNL